MTKNIYDNELLFVGGDCRQIRAINRALEGGYKISVLGFCEKDISQLYGSVELLNDIKDCKKKYFGIILPLPYTTDGIHINSQQEKKIKIEDLFQNLPLNKAMLAGRADAYIKKLAESKSVNLIDYFDREDLQILNAIPTAEGAIQIAMEEVPYTIHSSECLIIGNGRIGKILAKMLSGIGANVTVAARKQKDMVLAEAFGYKTINSSMLYDKISGYDIIFNTAPALILDYDILLKTRRDVLVVDLASKPGGVDFDAARKMGLKVIWALSLPGKVAPDTAGDIVGKTILNIMEELEAKQ